jgi:hypothetical protein
MAETAAPLGDDSAYASGSEPRRGYVDTCCLRFEKCRGEPDEAVVVVVVVIPAAHVAGEAEREPLGAVADE